MKYFYDYFLLLIDTSQGVIFTRGLYTIDESVEKVVSCCEVEGCNLLFLTHDSTMLYMEIYVIWTFSIVTMSYENV